MQQLDVVIPSEIVDKHQAFDPETEDIIFADEIKDDMIVLIESSNRWPIAHLELHPKKLHEYNRWCRATKVRIDTEENRVHFIGVYADGNKIVRTTMATTGWVVKLQDDTSE